MATSIVVAFFLAGMHPASQAQPVPPINEEPEFCLDADEPFGDPDIPTLKGISTWSVGALIGEGCVWEVGTPMVPFYLDIGTLPPNWSIWFDYVSEHNGQVGCQKDEDSGNDDWWYGFYVHAEVAAGMTYNGGLPAKHGQSIVTIQTPGAEMEPAHFGGVGENAGGTKGSGRTLCEGLRTRAEGDAFALAGRWVSDQYDGLNSNYESTGRVSLVHAANGDHMVTTGDMDGSCSVDVEPLLAWAFECWFELIDPGHPWVKVPVFAQGESLLVG